MRCPTLLAWLLVTTVACAPTFSAPPGMRPALAAGTQTATVDLGVSKGPVTYRATGFLNRSLNSTDPPDALVTPLKPRLFRVGYDLGTLDQVYPRAVANGAVVQRLLSDPYHGVIPGVTESWSTWDTSVTNDVNAVLSKGYKVQWEVWNEPDASEFWSGTQAQWFDTWRETVRMVRSLNPGAPVLGPSLAQFSTPWISAFLDYAKANDVLPDIMTWHTWDREAVGSQVSSVKQLLAAKAIAINRFQIGEYALDTEQFKTANYVRYIEMMENAGVESASHSCWPDLGMGGASNCNSYTLNGIVTNESPKRPRSTWWVYKNYADMTGQLVQLTHIDGLAGLASRHTANGNVRILLGNLGLARSVSVQIKGLSSGAVSVTTSRIPYSDYNAVPSLTSATQSYTPVGGAITVNLPDFGYNDVYVVAIGGVSPLTDIQASSVPTGHKATAVSSSQINLSWTAPTENVGVTGYTFNLNTTVNQNDTIESRPR